MAITVNVGKTSKKPATKKKVVVEEQGELELTIEEQLVSAIGPKVLDKAAHIASQLEDLKAKSDALMSDLTPLKEAITEAINDADLPNNKKLLLVTASGTQCTVAAKKKATEIIDKEALYHALEESKEGLFFELSKIGLSDAKKYVAVKGNSKIYKETISKSDRQLTFKA